MGRTSILLGAGASVDAGLPLTFHLAERVVRSVNEAQGPRSGAVRALNFVYGSMVGHQSEDGSNPLAAVNIERLISAVRLLVDVKDHEAAPFVAAWKMGAVGEPDSFGRKGRRLTEALTRGITEGFGFADRDVEEAVRSIVREPGLGPGGAIFRQVEELVLRELTASLSEIKTTDYLKPIAGLAREQPGGLDVITLNYDMTVEQMAANHGIRVDRGIDRWSPGKSLEYAAGDGGINLYKLHGSLDWTYVPPRSAVSSPSIEINATLGHRGAVEPLPWIVVGDREKLATDGPTLDLLRAAEDALRRSTNLLIVGYSFSDVHINRIVRNWMLGTPTRQLGIIDVDWNHRAFDSFRNLLISHYGATEANGWTSRVIPYQGTAAEMLPRGLEMKGLATPDPYMRATITSRGEEVAAISIHLLGGDLHDVHIEASITSMGDSNPSPISLYSDIETLTKDVDGPHTSQYGAHRVVSRSMFRTGDSLEVFVRSDMIGHLTLRAMGQRLDSPQPRWFTMSIDG